MSKYQELRIKYDKLRQENRRLHSRLEASERCLDALSNRFQDQLEELENKTHNEITEQVRSLRNVNEIRFQILEGSLRDCLDQDMRPSEANMNRSLQDIQRISQRQQHLERRLNGLSITHPEEHASSGSLKLTPNNPIYGERTSPVEFLEELKDFWAAVRPTRAQTAIIISICLQGTPRDWWDLVKETTFRNS